MNFDVTSMSERILGLMNQNGYTYNDVAGTLGITTSSVYKWVRKKGQIQPDHLINLAKFLGTTPECIQFGITALERVTPSIERVSGLMTSLDESDQLLIAEMVNSYVQQKMRLSIKLEESYSDAV